MNGFDGTGHPAGSVLRELRRRRVGRVAVAYVAVAYAVVECARAFLPMAGASPSLFRTVLAAAAMGFPLATVLAWDFDITSRGIVRTREEEVRGPLPPRPRLPWLTFVTFWILVGLGVRLFT